MQRSPRPQPVTPEEVSRLFPVFAGELAAAFAKNGSRRRSPKGTIVYEQGFPCDAVPFLVTGVVRVYKIGESGREVTLFQVYPGQTCILSTSCGVSGASYPAIAGAEEELEMYTLPAAMFREWLNRYPPLQQFINVLLAERLAETMLVVEEVAFRRVDLRLAEWLLRESDPPRTAALETRPNRGGAGQRARGGQPHPEGLRAPRSRRARARADRGALAQRAPGLS